MGGKIRFYLVDYVQEFRVSIGKALSVACDTGQNRFGICYVNKQRQHSTSISEVADVQPGCGNRQSALVREPAHKLLPLTPSPSSAGPCYELVVSTCAMGCFSS